MLRQILSKSLLAAIPMLLVLSFSQKGFAEDDNGTFTVYFNNPDEWEEVNIWAWTEEDDESTGNLYEDWPGEAMEEPEEGENWYSKELPDTINYVIFNDGDENQTDDLYRTETGWFDGEEWHDNDPFAPFTVYFSNPDDWDEVYIWAWEEGGDNYSEEWPGEPMVAPEDGEVWWSYELPYNIDRVIFADADGDEQTDDLVRNSTGWFDGFNWYDEEIDPDAITEKESIEELLDEATEGDLYRLSEEVIVTFVAPTFRNQHYLSDETGAVLVDDPGNVLSGLSRGDGVTNFTFEFSSFEGDIQLLPETNTEPTSTGNELPYWESTLEDLEYVGEPRLVKVEDVDFQDEGVFESGTNYDILDPTVREPVTFRTHMSDSDVIGRLIPEVTTTVTAMISEFQDEPQLYAAHYDLIEFPTADLQIAHASGDPNIGEVDIYFNVSPGDGDPAYEGVSFQDITTFDPLPAGVEFNIYLTESGEDEVIYSVEDVELEEDGEYVAIARGEIGNDDNGDATTDEHSEFGIDLLAGKTESEEDDEIDVLVYHAVTDAPEVDVWVRDGDEALVEGLTFGQSSESYASLEAGTFHLDLYPAGEAPEDAEPLQSFRVEADGAGGQAAVALATGYIAGIEDDELPAFEVMLGFPNGDRAFPANTTSSGDDEVYVDVPGDIELNQNYPNPFNPTTNIEYQIPSDMHVELTVYNTLGQEVATLVDDQIQVGTHEVTFDGSNLASGVYIYRLQADGQVITNQMTLVK